MREKCASCSPFTFHASRSTFHSSHHFQQCFRHLRWSRGNPDSRGLEGGDFCCGGSFFAPPPRARIGHSAARGGGCPPHKKHQPTSCGFVWSFPRLLP